MTLLSMDTHKAYIAAVIDCDGCISIGAYKKTDGSTEYKLQVVVTQSDPEFLSHLQQITETGSLSERKQKAIHFPVKYKRPCWDWRLSQAQAEKLLREIIPYLWLKEEQARVALEFRDTMLPIGGNGKVLADDVIEKRLELIKEFRELKPDETRGRKRKRT